MLKLNVANSMMSYHRHARCAVALIMIFMMGIPLITFAQPGKTREALVIEADTLIGREDYAGALKIFSRILGKSRDRTTEDYPLIYKRAYCYYALNEFDSALTDINSYIKMVPDEQARLLRAYINQELEDYDAQLEDLNAFIVANPGNPELLRWRASVYIESERYRDARNDLAQLMAFSPGPELHAYFGLTYYYLDDPDSAMMIFDEVIESNPDYIQSYIYASSISLEQEASDLALQYIEQGLNVETGNLTLLFYKGIALVEKEKIEEGCRCLTKAFEGGLDDATDYLKNYCYGAN
jgi:tetratricopeptide (TPR) repeat protein